MVKIVLVYGLLALVREGLTVSYFQSVSKSLAGTGSILSCLIEILDLFVLSTIVLAMVKYGTFIPGIVYSLAAGVGTYIAIKVNSKRKA